MGANPGGLPCSDQRDQKWEVTGETGKRERLGPWSRRFSPTGPRDGYRRRVDAGVVLGLVVIAAGLWFALAVFIGYRIGWRRGQQALSAQILRETPKTPSMDLSNSVARDPRRG